MQALRLKIDPQILARFPEVKLGYVAVRRVNELAKQEIPDQVASCVRVGKIIHQLTPQNYSEHEAIVRWRQIYEACGISPKTYKSSVEFLTERFIKNTYRPVHPAVDVYNHVSVGNLLPMGGYNLEKLQGALTLRFGRPGDAFTGINKQSMPVAEQHVVYADESARDNVVCWMWNHKDARRTMLQPDTARALFLIDSTRTDEAERLQFALEDLSDFFTLMGAEVVVAGTVGADQVETEIKY